MTNNNFSESQLSDTSFGAMNFETFIKKVYKCERSDIPEANTDFYFALVSKFKKLEGSKKETAIDYGFHFGCAYTIIVYAIRKFIDDNKAELSPEEIARLDDYTGITDNKTIESIEIYFKGIRPILSNFEIYV